MKHRRPVSVPLAAVAMFFTAAMLLRAGQPLSGTLVQDARMDVIAEGKPIGFIKIPRGTKVMVLSTNASGELLIKRTATDSPFAVPADSVSVEEPAGTPVPAPTPPPSPVILRAATPKPAASATSSPSVPGSKDPTVEEVNHALGIPLFGSGSLWDEKAALVANRLRWPQESKTSYETSYRRYPYTFNAETKVFGVRALSLFLQGGGERTSRATILFANKGDVSFYMSPQDAAKQREDQPLNVTDGMMRSFQEAMRTEQSTLRSALSALFGDSRRVSLGRFMATREEAQRWDWKGNSLLLVHQPNEYLMLRIVPTRELEDADSPKQAFSAAKQDLANRVTRRPNGDVIITDLPMVNQGRKGYCVPATFERLLRYYGLPVDMNILAMAGKTDASGGTSIAQIEQATYGVIADAGGAIHSRNFSGSIQEIKQFIDAGKPLIFAHYSTQEFNKRVNERMRRRIAVTDWDEWVDRFLPAMKKGPPLKPDRDFCHVCLIIGYNEKSREIAITDSWGPAATERWMTEEEARQVMQPTGLSVIE